ncbi:MAG: PAS domain S-box protein [Candidatus Aminicenantales bacterium]
MEILFRAKKALREREQIFRSLAENCPNMIFIIQKGRIVYANQECEKFMGYSRKEFYAPDFNFLYLIAPEFQEKVNSSFRKHINGEEVHPYEYALITKKGKRLQAIITTKLIHYEGEKAILGIVTDITDRKHIEENLRKERDRAQKYLDVAGVMLVVIGADQKVKLINKKGCEILDYEESEILDKNWFENFLSERMQESVRSVFLKILSGEIAALEYYENPVRTKSGKEKIIAWHNTILRDEKGGITATLSSGEDISERKKAEEKINASLQEKEVMLREIHHRVKNNLQIISSLLRLQSNSIKDKEALEKFQASQNRIKAMALIHESLYKSTDLARIDFSDYIRMQTEHLFSMFRREASPVSLQLDIGEIHLDINSAVPCGQIINELVTNALKHAFPKGRNGEILIRMKADHQGKILLVIGDNGIGLPRKLNFRKTETLGLQIVCDLVRQLDGTIYLNRDRGTEFRISFRIPARKR